MLFFSYKLSKVNGKHLEAFSHEHILSLMYKLTTSVKDTDDLSIGFFRDRVRRQRELSNNKNQKGKSHLRFILRDVFGFAENQEKGTDGLGRNLTLVRPSKSSVLNQTNATLNAKIKFNRSEGYVPQ